MSPITIRFTNELQDHLDAQHVLYRRGLFAKLDKVIAILIFSGGVYCVALVGWRWWTIFVFALAFAEWFNLLSLSDWKTKIEFQRNPKFRDEYHLTFSRENIHFKTANLDSTLKWTHYESFVESPNLFLLMYGKGIYTLVPKRCFESKEVTSAFRKLLEQTIGN